MSSGEKTEKPTSKRISDSRKKGQVAKSPDLTGSVLFLAGMCSLLFSFPWISFRLKEFLRMGLVDLQPFDRRPELAEAAARAAWELLMISSPAFVAMIIAAAAGSYLQTGPLFAVEPLIPKPQKVDPWGNFQEKFLKPKSYIEFLKTVFKGIGIVAVSAYVGSEYYEHLFSLSTMRNASIGDFILAAVFQTAILISIGFVAIGILDVLLQRFLHERELRMTKHEVRQEMKESEGNPEIKGRRQQIRRETTATPVAAAIRRANVVVTNPTHLAVALSYQRGVDEAPVIVAKGADYMAAHIRKLAQDADVPLKEDVLLARALYEVELEEEIPEQLYEAVASVMRWVYENSQEG
jgi:flagellar biosynthesis protein FlhB